MAVQRTSEQNSPGIETLRNPYLYLSLFCFFVVFVAWFWPALFSLVIPYIVVVCLLVFSAGFWDTQILHTPSVVFLHLFTGLHHTDCATGHAFTRWEKGR